jgi:hypothetical protein
MMTTRNVGFVAAVALAALPGFPSTQSRAADDREPGPPQEAIALTPKQAKRLDEMEARQPSRPIGFTDAGAFPPPP